MEFDLDKMVAEAQRNVRNLVDYKAERHLAEMRVNVEAARSRLQITEDDENGKNALKAAELYSAAQQLHRATYGRD